MPPFLTDPYGRSPSQLLADAKAQRDANDVVEAATLAYLSLNADTDKTPLKAAERSEANLMLSEINGELGHYAMERIHAKQALRDYADQPLPPAAVQGRILKRLGAIAARIGDFPVAQYQYEQALAIFEAAESSTTDCVGSHLALARLALQQANMTYEIDNSAIESMRGAQKHVDVAIELILSIHGDEKLSREIKRLQAELLLNIWGNLRSQHQHIADETVAKAETMLLDVLAVTRSDPSSHLNDQIAILNGLITAMRRSGRYVDAMTYAEEAQKITNALQRVDIDLTMNMVLVAAHLKDPTSVATLCGIVTNKEQTVFNGLTAISSEAVAIAYSGHGCFRSKICLSLLSNLEADVTRGELMLNIILKRKAITADAEARFWRILHQASASEFSEARSRLLDLRQRLSVKVAARDAHDLWRLTNMIESEEERLAVETAWHDVDDNPSIAKASRIVAAYGQSILTGRSSWESIKALEESFDTAEISSSSVAKAMPADSVLVEFARIENYDLVREIFTQDARYWAFILHPDGRSEAVNLGEAAAIEQQIFEARKTLSTGDRLLAQPQLEAMSYLYNKLWSPISGLVGKADRVIISPEGSLALVPFGSLLDSSSRFLIEKKSLYYISSGRAFTQSSKGESGAPVVVGDPTFDYDKVHRGVSVVPKRLSRLEGTRAEAELVAETLGIDVSLLLDSNASETQVRQVQSPHILHIASHGLFLGEDNPPSTDKLSPQDHMAIDAAYPRHVYTLSRSGIALAGVCSGGLSETDDGFLTAYDVTSMNLHGTELVILSGCDTGLGSVFVGEGVLGLRRSFRIAGARYVVMSLWRLPDREAVRQMREFYKAYETEGDPVIALRDVQRIRIKWYRKALGGTPPPAVWAALTVDGIPREEGNRRRSALL